ncbi:venom protein 302-like isoform X3 [Oratosquilla oratoria]|uniref:venom protein 302-like isoform X3 n=1 Tax=Oratosquilla oratoria TaxID=337810 RepID=UPI003F7607BB
MDIKTSPHLLLLLLGVLAFVQRIQGLSCLQCNKSDCPPLNPFTCPAGTESDVCGCCTVCAKAQYEVCGGPWFIHGNCGRGLFCLRDESDFNSDGICIRGGGKPIVFPGRGPPRRNRH